MFTAGASSMAYHSGYQAIPVRTKPAKRGKSKKGKDATEQSTPKSPSHTEKSFSPLSTKTSNDFLGPAVDGPPSPERLRQMSKHMRTSQLRRQPGHQPASSASSSLTSFTAEVSAWEQDLNNMTHGLARRSSTRSAVSSSPSRDRTETAPRFGKSLFQRRGKSKRDSTSHSSSNSSLYSTDLPADNAGPGSKESLIPGLFSRRKASRDDPASQRKPQISGPFNFQHVTQTNRDKKKGKKQRGNQEDLTLDLNSPDTRPVDANSTPTAYRAPTLRNFQLPNISVDSQDEQDGDAPSAPSSTRPPLLPHHTAPTPGPARLMKQARSQDQLRVHQPRVAPPRPPRSPMHPPTSPPLNAPPPPRSSSRQSTYEDGYGSFSTTPSDRPQTSGGFRRPLPFSPADSPESCPSPAARQGYTSPAESEVFPTDDKLLSPTMPTSSEAGWPLSGFGAGSYEDALSDVPEEDEYHALTRRSRLSLASNNSSLRGSQSVPMLRALAQSQPHRPTSGASETLGWFDAAATQRTTTTGLAGSRESWEDDIDYCYEHEVEADCDYQWERPSLDSVRDAEAPPILVALLEGELAEAKPASTAKSSPGTLSAPEFDMSVLSPDSQPSSALGDGAARTTSPSGVSNNFSLPRAEKKGPRASVFKNNNRASTASSFKESHGFTLSPSLLIPTEYQQELLLCEAQKYDNQADNEIGGPCHQAAFYDYGPVRMDRLSTLNSHLRSSTSTTETHSTSRSTSTGERHESTNSTWTALTRHTASNTSLNKMNEELAPTRHAAGRTIDDGGSQSSLGGFPDTLPELGSSDVGVTGKKPNHKSHVSESVVHDDLPPLRSPEMKKTRRSRARTTSLSAQAPPTGQYALFPRGQLKSTGDRI